MLFMNQLCFNIVTFAIAFRQADHEPPCREPADHEPADHEPPMILNQKIIAI